MSDIKNFIAKNITKLRKMNGMTQTELAEKLNYSDKAISKWERGESVPDISVLKQIAGIFNVTLDYLTEDNNDPKPLKKQSVKLDFRNHAFVTVICILAVWLIATLVFVTVDITVKSPKMHWLAFVYAVPASMIVWLIFNSIWFNSHRNFVIISCLLWSLILALYFTFLPFGQNIWLIFVIGIPSQAIIFFWSKIKRKAW